MLPQAYSMLRYIHGLHGVKLEAQMLKYTNKYSRLRSQDHQKMVLPTNNVKFGAKIVVE